MLVPKFVTTLHDYDREQFTRDLGAVGIVALPLAIAFADGRAGNVRRDVNDAMMPCS